MIWKLLAKVISHPKIADAIVKRAYKTPYVHLEGYMHRWWLFNPYGYLQGEKGARWKWLPSIRVHHILREDLDEAMHDHPWNARTIILQGWYIENRLENGAVVQHGRGSGMTSKLAFGEYHKITSVSAGGVYTLFFTWKYQGVWGFLSNGVKVPFYEYLKGKVR